jgi:hypothetical protein
LQPSTYFTHGLRLLFSKKKARTNRGGVKGMKGKVGKSDLIMHKKHKTTNILLPFLFSKTSIILRRREYLLIIVRHLKEEKKKNKFYPFNLNDDKHQTSESKRSPTKPEKSKRKIEHKILEDNTNELQSRNIMVFFFYLVNFTLTL